MKTSGEMISPVVLTASEALCLCVPYLGEAKRLAVTANQSGREGGGGREGCACVFVRRQSAGYESEGGKGGQGKND